VKKKFWLALFLVFTLTVFAAFAETEQTDQGKAFDDVWVGHGYHLDVYSEEGGYIVEVEKLDNEKTGEGFIWEYKLNLVGDKLVSVGALKWPAKFENDEVLEGDKPYYDNGAAEFTINEQGQLVWDDMREHVADGLTFTPIGRFEGTWPGVNASADITWAEDHYTIYLDVPGEGNKVESYMYNGTYNRENKSLEAVGTCDVITYVDNEETERVTGEESVEAVFTINDQYRLVWENHRPGGVPEYVFDNPYEVLADSNG